MDASFTDMDAIEKHEVAPVSVSPSPPSSSPPIASRNKVTVKAESDLHDNDDDKGKVPPLLPPKPPVRFSASEFLALWRRAAGAAIPPDVRNRAASPHLGTLTVGSVVFAPCRVEGSASPLRGPLHVPPPYRLHYALAEVTGIQVMAGTVTVSFLFTDPGVDDEAISLYECIPCPPTCLTRWLQDEGAGEELCTTANGTTVSSPCCSLLERALRITPQDGPLPVNDIYRSLVVSSAVRHKEGAEATGLTAAQQQCAAHLRSLYCMSDEDEEDTHEKRNGPDGNQRGGDVNGGCEAGKRRKREEDVHAKNPPQLPPASSAEPSSDATAPLFTWRTLNTSLSSCAQQSAAVKEGATALSVRYTAPLSLHVFFARVFQMVNVFMERQCRPSRRHATGSLWRHLQQQQQQQRFAPPRSPVVVLVLFDSYAALRRFHVYMTVRGHVVQLQDGTDSSPAEQVPASSPPRTDAQCVCMGRPPSPPRIAVAFGTECKVWICMLRDDTAEEDANAGRGDAEAVIAAQLRRLLASAPPIDALVSFKEHATGQSDDGAEDDEASALVTAERVLLQLLPHLGTARLVCHLHEVPAPPLRPGASTTTTTATSALASPQSAATNVVKVSGAIFGDRKLLVPSSPEQLTLLASVLADDPPPPPSPSTPFPPSTSSAAAAAEACAGSGTNTRQSKTAQKRPRPADDSTNALHALTPALLERIALGTFTDSAASALFDAFGDATAVVAAPPLVSSTCLPPPLLQAVPQVALSTLPGRGPLPTLLGTVEDVYEKWCVDPTRFGEAFPVFQAVYALVADVFGSPSRFRSRRGPLPPQQQQYGGPPTCFAPSTFPPDPSALPRIALVLPRGNPTHHPSLSTQQFLHALHLFFTPWTLYEVGPAAPATLSASALSSTNTCVLWYQRGGLLLLFCDEPTTQLGALQDDADVVIACGKAAAAWVAANAATSQDHRTAPAETPAVYFAVISEMEVVPPVEQGAHLWLPITLRAPSLQRSSSSSRSVDARKDGVKLAEGEDDEVVMEARWPSTSASEAELTRGQAQVLWQRLLSTVGADGNPLPFSPASASSSSFPQSSERPPQLSSPANSSSASPPGRRLRHVEVLPKTLRQAVVLWRHLSPAAEAACPSGWSEREDEGTSWPMLKALVKSIALTCATATPVRMSDVTLVRRADDFSQ